MALNEFFNNSNKTSPHFEMHSNIIDPAKIVCFNIIIELVHPDLRCKFLKETHYCDDGDNINLYFYVLYCIVGMSNYFQMGLVVILILFLSLIIYIILSTTADKMFCPCLRVFSYFLGLNESVAGVTLLAFGNCAPELFGTIVRLKEESRVPVSDLYGSCMFVSFFVGGLIVLLKPFKLEWFIYLRDNLFLLLAFLAVHFYIETDNIVSNFEAVSLMGLYLGYIGIVVLDQYLLQQKAKHIKNMASENRASNYELKELRRITRKNSFQYSKYSTFEGSDQSKKIAMTRIIYHDPNAKPNTSLFTFFLWTFSLFNHVEFHSTGIFGKLFMMISLPIKFLITAFVPIVDYEMNNHGWSKLLNCIQIVVLPFVVISQEFKYEFMKIPWCFFSLIVTVPSAVFMFLTSRADLPPKLHLLMGVLNVWASLFIIAACAAEIINLLKMIGVITYRNNAFLGCTLLALGNSIGDLISNVVVAKSGYPIMGYTACFGGPIFNSLFIIGTLAVYRNFYLSSLDKIIDFDESSTGLNVYYYTIIGLILTIFTILICNFVFRRCVGILILTFYAVFCIFSTLTEVQVIHSFGTQHSHDDISYPIADEIANRE